MKPSTTLLAASVALIAHGLVVADSGRSLNQVRSQMNSGSWTGITLIEAKPKAESPATAASAAAAPASASAGAKAQAAAPATAAAAPAGSQPSAGKRLGALLGWDQPLSGQPMNAATRLDSPSVGIALPTAAAAASAASASSTKGR